MKKNLYALIPLSLLGLAAFSQPGGVGTNLTLWVKAGSGVSTTGSLVDTWTYANNANSFTSTGAARPTLSNSVINFNPTVSFSGSQLMDGPTGVNAPITAGDDDYSVFVVWRTNVANTFQRVWEQRSTCGFCNDALSLATWDNSAPYTTPPNRYGDETATPPFSHTIAQGFTAGNFIITQLNLLNQATNDLEIVDDQNLSTAPLQLNTDPGGTPNGAALRALSDAVNRMGADQNGSGALNGDIAEIIVYDRPISGAERAQIFSYLSLKYGIPIKTNLVNSSGTVIWNATTNSAFNTSVFGIGRDNTSGLLVTSSNSITSGSGNGTGQTGLGNVLITNPSSIAADNSFLIIGNDNGALTETTTNVPTPVAGSQRLVRQWKVATTGVGTVDLSIDLTGLTVTGVVNTDFRLMIDQDGDGDFTTGPIRYVTPVSIAGGVASFTGVTLNNNEVFALMTFNALATLPVKWISFKAQEVNDDIKLNWVVDNNDLGKVFEIQHSLNGVTFTKVGAVNNDKNVKSYSYTYTPLTAGTHYFRIREVDMDGRGFYSIIVSATSNKAAEYSIKLMSNPVRDHIEAVVNAARPGKALIEIWSMEGTKVVAKEQTINTGTNTVRVDMNTVPAGSYIFKVQVGNTTLNKKITKL